MYVSTKTKYRVKSMSNGVYKRPTCIHMLVLFVPNIMFSHFYLKRDPFCFYLEYEPSEQVHKARNRYDTTTQQQS